MEGWVKLHRKLLENPIVMKDADYIAIWIWLILKAAHQPHDAMHNGKRITLQPGQLTTGRKKISQELHINEYKIERVLSCFENEQQIAQQKCPKNRLISILNWNEYQETAQQNAQQMHNKCTTDAHITRMKELKNNIYSRAKQNQFHNFEERKDDLDADLMDNFNKLVEGQNG